MNMDDHESADVDRASGRNGEKMFALKKWNAVAMWSWDVECDTCAICRVQVMGMQLSLFTFAFPSCTYVCTLFFPLSVPLTNLTASDLIINVSTDLLCCAKFGLLISYRHFINNCLSL